MKNSPDIDLSGLDDHDRQKIAYLAHVLKKSHSEIIAAAVELFSETMQAQRKDDEEIAKAYQAKLREHRGGRGQA